MPRFREPLLIPFCAFAVGVIAASQGWADLTESLIAASLLTALWAMARWRNLNIAKQAALWMAVVFAGAGVFHLRAPGPSPQLDSGDGEVIELAGCVIEPPKFHPDREQFVIEIAPGARARVNVYLRDGEKPPALEYGQRVVVEGRAQPPRNFANEGAFDIENFLARQRIFWLVAQRSGVPVRVESGACGNAAMSRLYAARGWILGRIDEQFGSDAPKTAALLIGESAKLDRDWTESFRRTGTYHALVVSGTHITVLAGLIAFLLRGVVRAELPALLVSTALAWAYAVIAGGSAPVVRAAAGFTLFLGCRFFFREARVLNLLAAVAWGFLIWDPMSLFDASFQLSFGALAGICAIAMPIDERWLMPWQSAVSSAAETRLGTEAAVIRVELQLLAELIALWLRVPVKWVWLATRWLVRPVLLVSRVVLASAAVQITLAAAFVVYFHRFAFTGVIANVGVVLALETAIATGFAAVVTGLTPLIAITRWLIDAAAWLSTFYVRWEPDWRIPAPPAWLIVAMLAAIVSAGVLLRTARRWAPLPLAAGTAAAVVMIVHPFPVRADRARLEFTMIDVGQGDGLFLHFPDGSSMAVDAGGFPSFGARARQRATIDIGEEVVSPYLWSRSIRQLDIVALTHAHADHMGGMAALIRNFRPRELWISGRGKSPELDELLATARSHGTRVRVMRFGEQVNFGQAQVRVVAPPETWTNDGAPHNNDSLGLRVTMGRHSFLLAGDMERRVEEAMLEINNERRVEEAMLDAPGVGANHTDVLKVAHHGSRTSTSPAFVETAHPAFAMISAGARNRFGHPHPDVIRRLDELHAMILRTDRHGRISLSTDGRYLSLDVFRWPSAAR